MEVLIYRNNIPLKAKKGPSGTSNFRLLFASFFIILCMAKPVVAQSLDLGGIDFFVSNQKLSNVLLRLGNEANLNFSYNAGDSIFNEEINYTATNKQPLIVLDELLTNVGCKFKMVGNQIVIYRDSDFEILPTPIFDPLNNVVHVPESVLEEEFTSQKIDILPLTDTIFIRDTIIKFQTDTVFIVDTIIVEKEKPIRASVSKIKEIPVDYFTKEASREKGWSGTVFAAPILSNFSLVREESKFSIRNFSLGVEVSKIFNKWNVTGGLKLTQFAEKFNHSFSMQEGGFFVTDTIDVYYTVEITDTTYYYVTDSTWKPINNQEYNYNINNRIGLLEFMASLSYDFFSNSNVRLYLKGGAQLGIMIYKSGLAIPDHNQPSGFNFANLKFNTQSISVLAGIGMKYRINKYIDFNSELFYLRYLDDIVIDYPTSTRIDGLGLKLGLTYYF